MMDSSATASTINWVPDGPSSHAAGHTSNGYHQIIHNRNMNGHQSNHARRGGGNRTGSSTTRFLPDHIPIVPAPANNNRNNQNNGNYNYRQRNGQQLQQDRTASVYRLENMSNGDLMSLYPVTPWVKRVYSLPPAIGLHEEIEDFYEFIKPTEEEEFMRNKVVSRIEEVVLRLWPSAKVVLFGSFATKLYLPTSDIDLMIMGKWDMPPLFTLKNELIKADIADDDNIKVLDKASVPIVKVIDKETEVRVDISFNITNGSRSAELVKEFMVKYPGLAKLVFVLKQFLYQRQLNEVFTGGISSYSLILMTISFLQMHPRVQMHTECTNLGVLLIEFFELYGRLFNYLKVGIRVVGDGSYVTKSEIQEQMDSGYRPSILCIQDPLNFQNDIGKSSYGAMNVRKAFDNAYMRLNQECGSPARQDGPPAASILGHIIKLEEDVLERRKQIKREFSGPMREAINSGQQSSAAVNSSNSSMAMIPSSSATASSAATRR